MPFPARRLGGESAKDAERRARDSELDAIRQSISGGGATRPFYSFEMGNTTSSLIRLQAPTVIGSGSPSGNDSSPITLSRNGTTVSQVNDVIYNQNNSNLGVFLIQSAGLYRIYVDFLFSFNGSESLVEAEIVLNGTKTFKSHASLVKTEETTCHESLIIDKVLLLEVGDQIQFRFVQSGVSGVIDLRMVHGSIVGY